MNTDIQHSFSYRCDRKTNMILLRERLHGYPIPPGWRVHYGDSSILVTCPRNRQTIKADIYNTVDVDITTGKGDTLAVASRRHKCRDLNHTWETFDLAMKELMGV